MAYELVTSPGPDCIAAIRRGLADATAVVQEYGTKEAILPQEVQDVAMAWVTAG